MAKPVKKYLRPELNFAFTGDSRMCVLTETEVLGIVPKKIEIPFALLKEAAAQILWFEANLELGKLPKIAQDPKHKDSWPKGIRGKLRMSEILMDEAKAEMAQAAMEGDEGELGRGAGKIAGEIKPRPAEDGPIPGFDTEGG